MTMNKKKVNHDTRKTVYTEKLSDWCHHAKESDYIEVTQWTNHDGYDIFIHTARSGAEVISVTDGEFQAMQALILLL